MVQEGKLKVSFHRWKYQSLERLMSSQGHTMMGPDVVHPSFSTPIPEA